MLSGSRVSGEVIRCETPQQLSKKRRLDRHASSLQDPANGIDRFSKLSDELLVLIFGQLELEELKNIAATNRRFYTIIRDYNGIFVNPHRNFAYDALENAVRNKSVGTVAYLFKKAIPFTEKYPTLPLLKDLSRLLYPQNTTTGNTGASIAIFNAPRQIDSKIGRFPIYQHGNGILMQAIRLQNVPLIEECVNSEFCEPLSEDVLFAAVETGNNTIFKLVFHSKRTNRSLQKDFFIFVCKNGTLEMLKELIHSYCLMNALQFEYDFAMHPEEDDKTHFFADIVRFFYEQGKWEHLKEILYIPETLFIPRKILTPNFTLPEHYDYLFQKAGFIKSCAKFEDDALEDVKKEVSALQASNFTLTQEDLNRALLNACHLGIVDVVVYLLENGADLADRDYLAIDWATMRNPSVSRYFIQNWNRLKIPPHVLERSCYLTMGQGIGDSLDILLSLVAQTYEHDKQNMIIKGMFTEAMIAETIDNQEDERFKNFLMSNVQCLNEMRLFPLKLSVESSSYRSIEMYFDSIRESRLDYNPEYAKDFMIYFIHLCEDEDILRYFLGLLIYYVNVGNQGSLKWDEEGNLQISNIITEILEVIGSSMVPDQDNIKRNLVVVKECEEKLNRLIEYLKVKYPIMNDEIFKDLQDEMEEFRFLFDIHHTTMLVNQEGAEYINANREVLAQNPGHLTAIIRATYHDVQFMLESMSLDVAAYPRVCDDILLLATKPDDFINHF